MKTIYFDCFAGAAGDMIIGALLNFLPTPELFRNELKKLTTLPTNEYELIIERAIKNGITGINFDVRTEIHEHDHSEHDHNHECHCEYNYNDQAQTHEQAAHVQNHDHEHDHINHNHVKHDYEYVHYDHNCDYNECDQANDHEHNDHSHDHAHVHRGLHDIEQMIMNSELSVRVKRESIRAFNLLAEAEARVHGTTPDKIHFHEVGAVDSIIDIVGTFILMEMLGWPRVLSSPLNVGSGTVKCAHGILPVPAPATEFLLHDIPVFSNGEPMERTTPTGALLIKILAAAFCNVPTGKIVASGFGLGNRTSSDMPNVLRALMIETETEDDKDGLVHEKLALLECNIDDMNPQDFEPVTEHLFSVGALDVWTQPIYMKKGRPAVRFCCLATPDLTRELTLILLKETTSQGVRVLEASRTRLPWRIDTITTQLGELRVKTVTLGENILRRTPEYEDLKKISREHNLPINEIRRRVAKEL